MSKQPTKYQRKETNLLEINQDRYKSPLVGIQTESAFALLPKILLITRNNASLTEVVCAISFRMNLSKRILSLRPCCGRWDLFILLGTSLELTRDTSSAIGFVCCRQCVTRTAAEQTCPTDTEWNQKRWRQPNADHHWIQYKLFTLHMYDSNTCLPG